MKLRPHMVDMFFRGMPVTGKMSQEVVDYIIKLEDDINSLELEININTLESQLEKDKNESRRTKF